MEIADAIAQAVYFRFSLFLCHQTVKELEAILAVVEEVPEVPELQEVPGVHEATVQEEHQGHRRR